VSCLFMHGRPVVPCNHAHNGVFHVHRLLQSNTTLREITINAKLSLVEFRDEKTQELDLSSKGYGKEEGIIIGALLQVLI
jgi:hypothetical protein